METLRMTLTIASHSTIRILVYNGPIGSSIQARCAECAHYASFSTTRNVYGAEHVYDSVAREFSGVVCATGRYDQEVG
jgi:hypothetical protein